MNSPRIWRFGVVGTGQMAARMVECMALSQRIKVVAVASEDASRARNFAQQHAIESSLDPFALLARADIDAVYIASATAQHAGHAIAALAAGKAVLCEKPLATSEQQAHEVATAAREHRRLFMEAQWTPALPAYRELRRLLLMGTVGTALHLRSEFGMALDPGTHGRLFAGEGSGVLLDFAVYPIVLALQLLGPVTTVQAALIKNREGVDIQASLQLDHASGARSQLAASLVAQMDNESVLSGTGGMVKFESPVMGFERLSVFRSLPHRPERMPPASGVKQSLVAGLRRQPWLRKLKSSFPRGASSTHSWGANRYLPQLVHFLGLLDAGAVESELMPIDTSLAVMRVVDAARSGLSNEINLAL